jgi:thiamine-phosphate diphosphorylase
VLQIRERDLEAAALAALTSEVVGLARGTQTRIVVNDRLDVAMAAGASGIHLRADSMPAAEIRSVVPPRFLVGCSVHELEEARAMPPSVDYLIAGTVWETASKPPGSSVLGVGGLAEIVRATRVPVLAIGGITLDSLGAIATAGAAGIAAIGLFMAAPDAERTGCRAMSLDSIAQRARTRFDASR